MSAPGPIASPSRDAELAVRNGFKLGAALGMTWTIGLAARILLPRLLGPDSFGEINFADAFSATAFVLVGLGLDTYIRKEVAIRHGLASEIFGGTLMLRLALGALVFAAVALLLNATGRPPELRRLVYLFSGAQFFLSINGSLAAMLHARGRVDGLAVVSVLAKVTWAAVLLSGFLLGDLLHAVPLALLLSEAGKTLALLRLSRRHLGLRLTVDLPASRAAVVASLPFFVHLVATTTYARVDVSILSFLVGDDREIGWYSAAATLARIGLLLAPLMTWTLMPLFSRAAARSEDELARTIARSMEALLVIATPVSLMLALGADLWIRLVFGSEYAPAATALRILAPIFVITYVAAVSSIALNVSGRGWPVTVVALAGMIFIPGADLILIPRATGPGHALGAAGAACATAALVVELGLTFALVVLLRGRLFDRRGATLAVRTVLVCVLVTGLHLAWEGTEASRLAVDLLGYLLLGIALRVLPWREMLEFVRSALRRSEEPDFGVDSPSAG